MSYRIPISEVAERLGPSPFRFVLGLGFDLRSTEILKKLINHVNLKKTVAISNVGWDASNRNAVDYFHFHKKAEDQFVGSQCTNILQLADELAREVRGFSTDIRTVIDITSMSHELLAIFIALLSAYGKLSGAVLCYTGAKQYSFNTSETDIWLSKGVKTIRSVLGFPGEQLPSRPLHLVIPVGFEVQRAIEVISAYEPAFLSLGEGRREASVSVAHFESNNRFFKQLKSFVDDQKMYNETLSTFSFSCIDPIETKNDIKTHLSKFSGLNTVICPLNTKISTVGIALLCLEEPAIQICYSQPVEYNVDGYASAGDSVTMIDL